VTDSAQRVYRAAKTCGRAANSLLRTSARMGKDAATGG
jgi:hypothetical protein